jgi:L-asparaginase
VAERRVAILHTGGTIGMRPTGEGFAPEPGFLASQLEDLPELSRVARFELLEHDPLLDSASIRPSDWLAIARAVVDRAGEFDGCVILHGTDTMAYTASALAFMLRGLGKPVVLTGSQIPLCELRSDARANLLTALMIAAAEEPLREVTLFFGGRLLRGCRAVKVSVTGFDAFDSPNYPALASAGIDIAVDPLVANRLAIATAPVRLPRRLDASVGALRLFPGLSAELMRNALREPLQGLVLEAYGAGNGPSDDPELLRAIADATARGVVIVDCTQCMRGTVDLGAYATGSALARAGVIGGADLTVEAALAKLVFLLSTLRSSEHVRDLMVQSLCGELTPR